MSRKIDALVAEHVMDWTRENQSWYDEEATEGTCFTSPDGKTRDHAYGWDDEIDYDDLIRIPEYSTDPAAASVVARKVGARVDASPMATCLYALSLKGVFV